jgi:hypothetical protein
MTIEEKSKCAKRVTDSIGRILDDIRDMNPCEYEDGVLDALGWACSAIMDEEEDESNGQG